MLLISEERSQTFVRHLCCLAHATGCREDQRREGASLNLANTLLIGSSLFLLVAKIGHGGSGIRLSERIEHLDIKECSLESTTPKAMCCNVRAGIVFTVAAMPNQDLTIKRLQSWLNHHIMTNPLHEATSQIAQLVVANGGVSAHWARQSM